jgi:hypothetical protein
MEPFAGVVEYLAGTPALIGPILTALIIFLTSDWRVALMALVVQSTLVGLSLTRVIQPEVAVVKILVGILVALILYLSARRIQEMTWARSEEGASSRFPSLRTGWLGGSLGLPLRLLSVLLVALALIRLFQDYQLTIVPFDVALVACWMAGMGLIGLVLSADPMRMALAFLTILTAFDLVYAALEPSLAIVGFLGAFTLSAAVAFSYLAIAQGLHEGQVGSEEMEQ